MASLTSPKSLIRKIVVIEEAGDNRALGYNGNSGPIKKLNTNSLLLTICMFYFYNY